MRSAGDYSRVLAAGSRSSDRYFSVAALANDCGHPRLGLAISRAAAGGGVHRNRIKRWIREAFRCAQARLPACDIVVVARPSVAAAAARQIRASLDAHWRRIAARCDSY